MRVGDLVEQDGRRWLVINFDRTVKVGLVVDGSGSRKELADDACEVIANLPESWPTLAAPTRNGGGPFVKLVVPGILGRPETVLEPWVDWVQSDPLRDGGSLFIRPEVRLLPGVVLIATHRSGVSVRVTVPRTYGTVAQKQAAQAAAAARPPEPRNRFNHILDEDEE